MSFFIIITFSLSSIAYVVSYYGNTTEQTTEITDYIIKGEASQQAEYSKLSQGYTIMKFYYADESWLSYIETLPDVTASPSKQLIVEEIVANETYARIMSPINDETIYNITEAVLFDALCRSLYVSPIDCFEANMTAGPSV